jgi:CRISPR/Cas system-associated exonuclease Cas4 (RecB family)
LNYDKGYFLSETTKDEVLRKGSAFHEFAELYDPSWDEAAIAAKQKEVEEKHVVSSQYSLTEGIANFIEFWNKKISGNVKEIIREQKFEFDVGSKKFKGAIDFIGIKNDGSIIIIDWKSSKSAGNANDYKEQLLYYVIAVAQHYNVLPTDIEVGLFYPLAQPQKRLGVIGNWKLLFFSQEDLDIHVAIASEVINEIESPKRKTKAIPGSHCSWCAFAKVGMCDTAKRIGIPRVRGLTISQRDWATKQPSPSLGVFS